MNRSEAFGKFAVKTEFGTVIINLLLNLVLASVSFTLINYTLNYLKSKPPGLHSPIDQVNKYLLWSLKFTCVCAVTYFILVDCTLDTGEQLAKILTWPFFISVEIFIMYLIINSACYQVLSLYPHLIERDFNVPMAVCLALGLAYQVGLSIGFHCQGSLPPSYYNLRHIPVVESDLMLTYRRVSKALSLAVLVVTRLGMRFTTNRHLDDQRVISDKSLICLLGFLVSVSLLPIAWWNLDKYSPRWYISIVMVIVWPLCICLLSQNVRTFAQRQLQEDVNLLVETCSNSINKIKRWKSYLGSNNTVHSVTV